MLLEGSDSSQSLELTAPFCGSAGLPAQFVLRCADKGAIESQGCLMSEVSRFQPCGGTKEASHDIRQLEQGNGRARWIGIDRREGRTGNGPGDLASIRGGCGELLAVASWRERARCLGLVPQSGSGREVPGRLRVLLSKVYNVEEYQGLCGGTPNVWRISRHKDRAEIFGDLDFE